MLRIVFAHRFLADADLPLPRGDLWHGLFGACLHDTCTLAYAALMSADEQRRPWALQPPLDMEPWVPAGAEVEAGLTLFGGATRHASACIAALQQMGQRGFGRARVPAEMVRLAVQHADGRQQSLGSAVPAPVCALDVLDQAADALVRERDAAQPAAPLTALELRLLTPLWLKRDGQVLREAPPLQLLVRRLLGRLVLLAPQRPEGLFAAGDQAGALDLAARSPLLAQHLENLRWMRRSSRQGTRMPFEGQMGRLVYGPPAVALLPWFVLGEWLQIGGKTTFGLGVIQARPRELT